MAKATSTPGTESATMRRQSVSRCFASRLKPASKSRIGQEDVEDEVRGEAERVDVRHQAQHEADDHETDGVGHADPPRDDGDGGGDDQQEDERLLDGGSLTREGGEDHRRQALPPAARSG